MTEDTFKIVKLEAQGFMRLKAIEIAPTADGFVEIVGKNGEGKTSVLSAIWAALCGAAAHPEQPVNQDEREAKIVLELGGDGGTIVVEKSWKKGQNPKLTVTREDGNPQKSPQKLLNDLFSAIAFDPSEFMGSKNQREILLDMVELSPDWKQWTSFTKDEYNAADGDPLKYIDDFRAAKANQRKDAKKDYARLEAAVDTARAAIPKGREKAVRVSASAIAEKLEVARDHNTRRECITDDISTLNVAVESAHSEIERLKEQLATAQKDLEKLAPKVAAAEKALADHGEPIDLEPIKEEMKQIDAVNFAAQKVEDVARLSQEKKSAASVMDNLQYLVEDIDGFRKTLLDTAEMPLEGLTILGDTVMLNDVPFSQASHAERLRASVAIGIALNPRLKVITLDDAEKFDSDSMDAIKEMATEHGFQVWAARVGTSTESGLLIEDGEISDF